MVGVHRQPGVQLEVDKAHCAARTCACVVSAGAAPHGLRPLDLQQYRGRKHPLGVTERTATRQADRSHHTTERQEKTKGFCGVQGGAGGDGSGGVGGGDAAMNTTSVPWRGGAGGGAGGDERFKRSKVELSLSSGCTCKVERGHFIQSEFSPTCAWAMAACAAWQHDDHDSDNGNYDHHNDDNDDNDDDNDR